MKINSLQLLGTVIDDYSMDSFFEYYVSIQIEREKEHLKHVCLYETERPIDDHDGDYTMDWDDDDYLEYWTEDDYRVQYGFAA